MLSSGRSHGDALLYPGRLDHNDHSGYPVLTSDQAEKSINSSSTSPSSSYNAYSDDAPSYETNATNYEYETSWFHDDDDDKFDEDLYNRHSFISFDDSCAFDADDWFAHFHEDLDVSDNFPSRDILDKAGDVPVFDAAGNSRAFRSLYSVGDVVGDRQLVVFIRHFYCGACQAYIRALAKSISMDDYFSMAIPTSIIVVGCGSPELIRQYKARTSCPFPIFADPTRQIFKLLGMNISFNMFGPGRPEYMKDVTIPGWAIGQIKEVSHVKGKKRFRGGNIFQIGGEFLFQDGQVIWCHRMKNYRGHAEVDRLKKVLEIER